jgi:tellurite resistance protein TerA
MSFDLAAKFVLADKEEVTLPLGDLDVELAWTFDVDLDLLAFFRTKDGYEGGVASEHYPQGTLVETLDGQPFLSLSGDAGVGAKGGNNHEQITIHRIPETVEKIWILALNFTDARNGVASNFAKYDGFARVQNSTGEHSFGLELKDATPNPVFHIATIDNTANRPKLVNENTTMSLGALSGIPGTFRLTPKK